MKGRWSSDYTYHSMALVWAACATISLTLQLQANVINKSLAEENK